MPDENIKDNLRYVVDASFVLALVLSDERVDFVDEIFRRYALKEISLFSPYLLQFEVINSIAMAVKRKRASSKEALIFIGDFIKLAIPYITIEETLIFNAASRYGISAYDAAYIALARQMKVPLLTLDDRLKKLAVG